MITHHRGIRKNSKKNILNNLNNNILGLLGGPYTGLAASTWLPMGCSGTHNVTK